MTTCIIKEEPVTELDNNVPEYTATILPQGIKAEPSLNGESEFFASHIKTEPSLTAKEEFPSADVKLNLLKPEKLEWSEEGEANGLVECPQLEYYLPDTPGQLNQPEPREPPNLKFEPINAAKETESSAPSQLVPETTPSLDQVNCEFPVDPTPVGIVSVDGEGQYQYGCPYFPCSQAYPSVYELRCHVRDLHRVDQWYECGWPNCGDILPSMSETAVTNHTLNHLKTGFPGSDGGALDPPEQGLQGQEGVPGGNSGDSTGGNTNGGSAGAKIITEYSVEPKYIELIPTAAPPLKRMKISASDKLYQCPREGCVEVFATKQSLKAHSWTHYGVTPIVRRANSVVDPLYFRCESCEQVYFTKQGLAYHWKKSLSCSPPASSTSEPAVEQIVYETIQGEDDKTYYKCEGCDMVFKSRVGLGRHRQLPPTGGTFWCSWRDCGVGFRWKCQLEYHEKSHLAEPILIGQINKPPLAKKSVRSGWSFRCSLDDCGEMFPSSDALNSHIMQVHDKLYKCPIKGCGVRFAKQSELNQHVGSTHAIQQPTYVMVRMPRFPCPDCKRTFPNSYYLNMHHCKMRQFACRWSDCTRTFSTEGSLKQHITTIHKLQKPFTLYPWACTCPICSEGFSGHALLQEHIFRDHVANPTMPGQQRVLPIILSSGTTAPPRAAPAVGFSMVPGPTAVSTSVLPAIVPGTAVAPGPGQVYAIIPAPEKMVPRLAPGPAAVVPRLAPGPGLVRGSAALTSEPVTLAPGPPVATGPPVVPVPAVVPGPEPGPALRDSE